MSMIVRGKTSCSEWGGPGHFCRPEIASKLLCKDPDKKAFLPFFPVGLQVRNGLHILLVQLMKGCNVHLCDSLHRNDGYVGKVSFCRAFTEANSDSLLSSKEFLHFSWVAGLLTLGIWSPRVGPIFNF